MWGYSFDSAGLYTVFQTDASSIYLRWTKGCAALVRGRPDLKNAENLPMNCTRTIWLGSPARQNLESAYHFAATGMLGVDLYGWDTLTQRWRYVVTTSPPTTNETNSVLLLGNIPSDDALRQAGSRKWMVVWPSYDNVVSASIGVPQGQPTAVASPVEPPERRTRLPIVW
eukprot:COSAG01_NODE_13364_length_1595_cov_3.054813_1_plen_170_part_00